jgi:hypothetical protein
MEGKMYEITIKKKDVMVTIQGAEWETIDQEPVNGSDKLKDVYGYTPEIEKREEIEIEILKQVVEELDLAAVIKAINKL